MKKKIISKKLEKVLIFILGVIFASGLNVLADACTTTLSSTEITYGSTDVKSALDDLYAVNTGTAGASQVLTGYTFSNDSDIGVAGTMANNGAVSESVGVGGSYTIPAGYHNGSGTVTGPTLSGDAGAANVLTGKTFYSNSGTKQTGTMANLSTSTRYQYTSSNSTPVVLGDQVFLGNLYDKVAKANSGNYVNIRYNGSSGYLQNNTLIGVPYSTMASSIGLTAGKIVSGNTILGVSGTASPAASWVQVWSGSTTGNVSVNLSAYKYVVVQVTGGSWLMLQVGGSKGYIGYIGTSPDGMWGTWGGTRAYKATTSGITSDSDLYGATENKGKSWISITKVWGIKNLN